MEESPEDAPRKESILGGRIATFHIRAGTRPVTHH